MSLREKTLNGLLWATIQQISGQLVGIVISVILARLLYPEDFGLMGMIYIFIAIGTTMADAGLGQSLIRMTNPKEEDYSTVFFINVLFALLVYGILFLTAPLIAGFYNKQILTEIIRVYGLVFVFSSLSSVQNTILIRNMHFKRQFVVSLPSLVLSGALGITLASMGYGVWSLVWSGVAKAGLYALQLWFYSDWRPHTVFDRKRLSYHFRFGYKLSVNELLNNISTSIYPFVTGRFFSPAQTGYFTQAAAVKQFPIATLLSPINKVAYPTLSRLRSDKVKLREAYVKMERITLAAIIPAMVLGMVMAEPLLRLLFSERWIAATPYLQIACLTGIIQVAGTYNMLMLKTQGKSGLILHINIFHKVFMLLTLAVAIPFGIGAVLWSQIIVAMGMYIPGSVIVCRAIGYRFRKLMTDFLLLILIGAVMGAGVWGLKLVMAGVGDLFQLIACSIVGITLYVGLIAAFDRGIFNDLRELLAGSFIRWTGKKEHSEMVGSDIAE